MEWSTPLPYDLTRTLKRASIPKQNSKLVPTTPGVYTVINPRANILNERIIYLGRAGYRSGKGLKSRIANSCAHHGSELIASAILNNTIVNTLQIIWIETQTEQDGIDLEACLIQLFYREFNMLPEFNTQIPAFQNAELFEVLYNNLKSHQSQI